MLLEKRATVAVALFIFCNYLFLISSETTTDFGGYFEKNKLEKTVRS